MCAYRFTAMKNSPRMRYWFAMPLMGWRVQFLSKNIPTIQRDRAYWSWKRTAKVSLFTCLGYPGRAGFTGCVGDGVPTRSRQMGRDMEKETDMSRRPSKRLVREGEFVAEVEVALMEEAGGWTPYLSLDDAYKLDSVREALRAGDMKRASQLSERVYRLTPIPV